MNKLIQKINKQDAVFTALLFAAFAVLVFLFPYSGDDWAWGSKIGMERLANGFDNYNGRYGGNLLVMALTRSKLLNILVTSFSLVSACLLPRIFSGSKKLLPYAFGTLLLLLVPRQIFVQTIVWTSGYSNYVPPILMTMLYFVLVKNIFEEEKPRYHWACTAFVGILGFVSALFMENVTLYNVAISAMLALYALIKHRRVYITHIVHFIGCVAGAILMFSNSAYGAIASGADGYRSTAFGEGIKATVIDHTKVVYQQFFDNNLPVLAIFTLLSIGLYFLFAHSCTNKKQTAMGMVFTLVHVFTFGIMLAKHEYPQWILFVAHPASNILTIFFFAMVGILYFGSAGCIILLCIADQGKKWKTLFLLISIPILVAPLVLVNPIGGRCFFPPFFMLISVSVVMLDYICNAAKLSAVFSRWSAICILAGCLAIFTAQAGMYATIHTYDVKRNNYVQKQLAAGYDTVKVCLLPDSAQVWCGNPNVSPWEERYKYYHNIDQNVVFEFVDHTAFDQWAVSFDKELDSK